MHEAPQREHSLVAVFADEQSAWSAARRACDSGTDPGDVRIGNSLDALASIGGEMREETAHVPAMPVPFTREAKRGFSVGTVVGAVGGIVLVLPFAALPISSLDVPARLLLLGIVGLVFGSMVGWFIGGAIGIKRPDEPVTAAIGVTLAVPDSESARQALREAGALRIDVIGVEGQALDTVVSDDPGPAKIGEQLAQHTREEARPD